MQPTPSQGQSSSTEIFAFGSNAFGQLGPSSSSSDDEDHEPPQRLKLGPGWTPVAANWTQSVFHRGSKLAASPVEQQEQQNEYILLGLSPLVTDSDEVDPPSGSSVSFYLVTDRPFRAFLGADSFEAVIDGHGHAASCSSLPWSKIDLDKVNHYNTEYQQPLSGLSNSAIGRWSTAAADELGRVIAVEAETETPYLFAAIADLVRGSGGRPMSFDASTTGGDHNGSSSSSSPILGPISQIRAGASHFVFLLHTPAQHQLWGWGDDRFGQIQQPERTCTNPPFQPNLIDLRIRPIRFFSAEEHFVEDVLEIATAGRHCFARTASGAVYAWGANDQGQLGIGASSHADIQLVEFQDRQGGQNGSQNGAEDIINVTSVACGSAHTILVDEEGQVWVAGSNSDLQLGLASSTDDSEVEDEDRPLARLEVTISTREGPASQRARRQKFRPHPCFPPDTSASLSITCGATHTLIGKSPARG